MTCMFPISPSKNIWRNQECKILKNKEVIKAADVGKGVTVLEGVEKLLFVWISEKELAGDSVNETIICEKARQLHSH